MKKYLRALCWEEEDQVTRSKTHQNSHTNMQHNCAVSQSEKEAQWYLNKTVLGFLLNNNKNKLKAARGKTATDLLQGTHSALVLT